MKDTTFQLLAKRNLLGDVFELTLQGDVSDFSNPGQFVEISVPNQFLRRPISVCDWDCSSSTLRLLIREVGSGTAWLHALPNRASLQVITGLGNGFSIPPPSPYFSPQTIALVGGGIGIAPLYGLARRLTSLSFAPTVILGFRNAKGAFFINEFRSLGCNVITATEDGSLGIHGFVTDAIQSISSLSFVYACGPMPMLHAIAKLPQILDGQFSLEARMGCGFGACVGCTIQTSHGPARICKEGPIFQKGDILW